MTSNANKTFFSSFLAAFRAQNAAGIPKAPAPPSPSPQPSFPSAVASAASATSTGKHHASPIPVTGTKAGSGAGNHTPHPITTKTGRTPSPGPAVTATGTGTVTAQFTATRHHPSPPYVRSTSPIAAAHSRAHSPGYSPGYSPLSTSPAAAYTPNYPGSPGPGAAKFQMPGMSPASTLEGSRGRNRRGSDSSSSSGGFQDVLGREAWYIGGGTACGEERFYRLGVVRGRRSGDRLSVDRLSV